MSTPMLPLSRASSAVSNPLRGAVARGVDPTRAIEWNLWGITFIGLGLGLAAAFLVSGLFGLAGFVGQGGGFLGALGFALLVVHPEIFGSRQVRLAWLALGVGFDAVLAFEGIAIVPASGTGLEGFASALLLQLQAATVFVLVGGVAVYLAVASLHETHAKTLALVGLATLGIVQVVIYVSVMASVSSVLLTAAPSDGSAAFAAARTLWTRLGSLNAIPLVFFLGAYEVTYWRLRNRYVPQLSLIEV